MNDDKEETKPKSPEFDFSSFPGNTLFHERRTGRERRVDHLGGEPLPETMPPAPPKERRARKERRRRVDPTTFEKQYTVAEIEFMNAMQEYKIRTCKTFPTYGEVLKVAVAIGYRKSLDDDISVDA